MTEGQYKAALARHRRGGDDAWEQVEKLNAMHDQIVALLERERAALTTTIDEMRGTIAALERQRAAQDRTIAVQEKGIADAIAAWKQIRPVQKGNV
jgi:cytochrome c556